MQLPTNKFPWAKRESQNTGLPPEVKQYYESGQRERKSVAWLLAFAALIGTILVVFGAFFSGRWVYRKIAHRNKPAEVSTTQSTNTGKINENYSSNNENKPKRPAKKASQSNRSPQTSNSAPRSQTGSQADLANTGPAGTLATFAIATAAGTIYYEVRLRRKPAN